ncbi:MAG TPA: hypothetical protein PLD20_15340 [Blastocatellia bacterium]|nr:hypothetical protein [Blastocatellia bacterium]HMV84773.1 hypothetical protein [Blastocatellia bacterium]HMX25632.1 hypothetical protein [Blastocatellia bacterium]HMZ19309.1 hypothetical protein [Blastocatellia bacterium]HNG30502.1 hypothetical protein [Blastocatellia bacterium]
MSNGLSIFIGVALGILLIVQVGVFIGLYLLAKKLVALAERAGQLQTRAEYLMNNTEPVLKLAHSLMGELKEAAGYFAQGAEHINAIAAMAKDEAAEIRTLLGDTTAIARRELERTKDKVEKVQDTLAVATDQFERTTAMVQHSILEPAREFSYLMFGLRRAMNVMFAGNRRPVNQVYQDEEMFI